MKDLTRNTPCLASPVAILTGELGETVAVVGSRKYPDQSEVYSYVCSLGPHDVMVSGGAEGVDRTAEGAARALGLTVISYRPVKRFGKWQIAKAVFVPGEDVEVTLWLETFNTFSAAAYFRNGLIVADADRVASFWDGKSRGTKNTIDIANRQGKPVEVYCPDETER